MDPRVATDAAAAAVVVPRRRKREGVRGGVAMAMTITSRVNAALRACEKKPRKGRGINGLKSLPF